MKEGLIEARVNRLGNISQKIKEFINQKSNTAYTPFYQQQQNTTSRQGTSSRAKRSLTDWRQLYEKKHKIVPSKTYYPATSDGSRVRCSKTGQCQRQNRAFSTTKAISMTGERNYMTSHSKRSRNFSTKRSSMVDFALAQNCYENQILKDQKGPTEKEKKLYQKHNFIQIRFDFLKLGQYLSHLGKAQGGDGVKELNATESYAKAIRQCEKVKMIPYNLAKIKQKHKIDNSRYTQRLYNLVLLPEETLLNTGCAIISVRDVNIVWVGFKFSGKLYLMSNKTVKFVSGERELWERFRLRQVIGTGNSIVYEVGDEQGNIECVKEIRLDDKQSEFIFRKEVELLSKIRCNPHPNIVEYRGSYILQEQRGSINTYKKGYIQMEKGVANLKTYLGQRKEPFPQQDILMFITTMVEVFAHLQRSQVAHRDIKPSNILLFSQEPLYFKVCDVGAGTAVGFVDQTKEMTVIGTPYYLSPQLYRAYRQSMHLVNYKVYKSDCYSLGLLFLEFCSLKKIEDRLNNEADKVQKLIEVIKATYPNIIGLGKVLRKMLDQQIAARLDFIQLERFISQNNLLRNKIDKTMSLDPTLAQKLSQSNFITIDKVQDLAQMQALVSTQSKFDKLNISIPSGVSSKQHSSSQALEQLINIKYMRLTELKISMEMCSVGDKHVLMIAEALEKNKQMKSLNLSFWNNNVSEIGLKALLKTIKSNLIELRQLQLNLSSNQIKFDYSFEQDFDLSNLINLHSCDINLGFNSIQPDYLTPLFRQISHASGVRSMGLNLQSTKINAFHFNKATRQFYLLQDVQQLNLNVSCNSIRQQGMYAIGDLCVAMPRLNACRIIFRNAQISDKGFIQFLKTVSKISKLKELKLNLMNNQITEKSMKVGSPFLENLTNLQILDLNFSNNKLSDFAFKYLCNSVLLVKSLTKIRLVFDTCALTQKGCLYLGRLISQQPRLQQLDLSVRYNDIKFDGIQYICAGLIQVKKIRRLKLNLQGTLIGDYSANYLASCLLKLRSLTAVDLNLQNCDLTSQTMANIVKAVRQCCQKTEQISIDMRRNRQIKQQLLQQLRKSMQNRRVAIKVDNYTKPSFITA